MKVKKEQQQQQKQTGFVMYCICVCINGVPRPEAGQATSGQVHCKVKYATNESSTTFKLTSYLPLLLGLGSPFCVV